MHTSVYCYKYYNAIQSGCRETDAQARSEQHPEAEHDVNERFQLAELSVLC